MHTVHGTIICDLIPTFLMIDYPSIMKVLENLWIFPTTFALGQKLLIMTTVFVTTSCPGQRRMLYVLWEVYNLV